jgi:hypothetical protein
MANEIITEGEGSATPDSKHVFYDDNLKKKFKQCYMCSNRIYEDNDCFLDTDKIAVICSDCGSVYFGWDNGAK